MTPGDMEHMAAQNAVLMDTFAALLTAGLPPSAPQVLDAVAEHHTAVGRQWAPGPESYRALGQLYETDPLQRSMATAAHPDLPAWLAAAVDAFVTRRLEGGRT